MWVDEGRVAIHGLPPRTPAEEAIRRPEGGDGPPPMLESELGLVLREDTDEGV